MQHGKEAQQALVVALRKESVDRNVSSVVSAFQISRVALRKESVDRNPFAAFLTSTRTGRSPQGERG